VIGLSKRVLHPELLDEGAMPDNIVRESLLDLRWINRRFGGQRLLLEALEAEISRLGLTKFSVLDIASGSGDLPMAIVDWAQQRRLQPQVFALEYWYRHLSLFRSDFRRYPRLHPVCGDAFSAPFRDQMFDFVTCSLFFHHLTETEAGELLKGMARLARYAIVVSDLERHWLPFYYFQAFSRFFAKSFVSRADGVTSFRQAFRKEELEQVVKAACLSNYKVERRWPFRLLLISQMSAKMESHLA